jgi:hypothetical protein
MTVHDPRKLRDRLTEISAQLPFEVASRSMMGGFSGYADGRPFVSLSTGGFGIKLLPQDQARALTRRGAERMRHSPVGPASKSYIVFAERDIADDDFLVEWLVLAANTAPGPKPR